MGIFPENSVPNDTKRTARDVDARTISGAGVRYSNRLDRLDRLERQPPKAKYRTPAPNTRTAPE
jgi:hypothetical protein